MRTLVEPIEDETLARRFIALASAGDYGAFAELLDPDVVWYGTRGGMDAQRVVRGPDTYLAYMREVLGTFTILPGFYFNFFTFICKINKLIGGRFLFIDFHFAFNNQYSCIIFSGKIKFNLASFFNRAL